MILYLRIHLLLITSLLASVVSNAQKFSLEISPALGRHFASDVPSDRTGRIGLSFSGYAKVAEQLQIGAEILWTTRVRSPVSFYDTYDPITGVRIVEPTFNNSASKFIKGKYMFKTQGFPAMFAALGVGVTTFVFKEGTAEGKKTLVKKNNFSFSPEFGVRLNSNLSASIRYVHAGNTPDYDGLDFNQSTLSLRSITINPVLFVFTYQLSLSKRR